MSSSEQLLYNPEALAKNGAKTKRLRSTSASAAGAVAGILGLTNLVGFGFYVATSLFVGLLLITINAKRAPSIYFKGGAVEALSGGLLDMESLTGYILWWTLLYGIVHVYE